MCNWMDLLSGREGFAPDLPHSYEASKTSRSYEMVVPVYQDAYHETAG